MPSVLLSRRCTTDRFDPNEGAQDDLQLSQDNPRLSLMWPQMRVLVNKYGTVENVTNPIVI